MLKGMSVLLVVISALFWPMLTFGAGSQPPKALQADLAEIEFWQSVKNSMDVAELEIYLNIYPQGQFAPLANIRINKLKTAPTPAVKTTPVVADKTAKSDKIVLDKPPSPPPSVHECDRLAANPHDPGKTTSGLTMAAFAADDATAACRSAVEKYPDVARFHYQLGRTLHNIKLYRQALQAYRKAVELNYPAAMANLGFMYSNGFGVAKNTVEAAKWYRRAAEMGHADAMANLGFMFTKGRGVVKDNAEAVNWFRKAAEKGNASAMSNLGYAYNQGAGVTKNKEKAVNWFRKAAEKGNASAMHNYGALLDRRNYADRNPRVAARYILEAYMAGSEISRNALFHLHGKLQTDTRRAIQRNLRAAGVYSGAIDGKFGAITLSALDALKTKINTNLQTGRGWIGIKIQTLTNKITESLGINRRQGVRILEVNADGPAAWAGLEKSDIILEIKNKKIQTATDVAGIISNTASGTTIDVKVLRGKREKMFSVEVGQKLSSSLSHKTTKSDTVVTQSNADAMCRKSHGPGTTARKYESFGIQNHVCICAKSHTWNSEGTRCIKQ